MRTLPENTVDAWTAIHLATTGAEWIWLPTNRMGGTAAGTHPGDVSAVAGRRLIIIENKAIEDGTKIPFGRKAEQREMLRAVEDSGLTLLANRSDRPCLGWVFYGLPLASSTVLPTGLDWPSFPWFHHLVCPHSLDSHGIKKTGAVSIEHLKSLRPWRYDHCAESVTCPPWNPPLLGTYRALMDNGLIGLPIDPVNPRRFLEGLARHVQRAVRETAAVESQPEDLSMPDEENWIAMIEYVVRLMTYGTDHILGAIA